MSDVSTIFKSTKPAVLNFPHLIEPKAFMENGKPKGDPVFSTSIVFAKDHPDLPALKKVAVDVAQAKWPGRDIAADYKAGKIKMPWESGNKQIEKRNAKRSVKAQPADTALDFLKDAVLVRAKTGQEYPPRLAVLENGKITEDLNGVSLQQNKGKFYSGVEAYLELNLRATTVSGNDYVTAYINLVLSTNKGKRLGGGKSAAETFAGCVGQVSDVDPTETILEDEIAF